MTAIRNGGEFLSGLGVDTNQVDCQTTGEPHTAFTAPWRGKAREADKTALFDYVRHNASGVPLTKVVSDVFGVEATTGEADYRLAKRFFERYSDLFKTYERGPHKWVEPQLDLYRGLNLRQQSIQNKTSVRRGDGEATALQSEAESTDSDGDPQYAKERVQSYLDNYLQVRSDSVKGSLLEAMITDIEGNEDLWQVLANRVTDEYLCLPYNTRHNSGGKAGKVREGFESALAEATNRHNEAVVLTLTTDPKEHSGLSKALESLSANRSRLLQWLSTEYQLGHRPEYLSVLEFTETGLPHLHLVLFGVSYAVSQEQLAAKWGDYGQGWVVDARQAQNVHDTDVWRLHDDDRGIVALRDYLGKSIRGLQEVANSDGDELRDRLEDEDLSLWRQSLYWATERQYFTCSHSLKQSPANDGDTNGGLPPIVEWEFIGVRQYEAIPATVRQKARFVTHNRPPPTNPPPEGSQVV
jgi:hypothetical protein